jgi:hypothetical protein
LTLREWAGSFVNMARKLGVEFFLMLVIGLVLGLFGPFGTFAMSPAARIAFWMIYVLLGYAIFRPMIILGKWMSESYAITQIIGVGLALVVAAAPMTFMIALLFSGFDVRRTLHYEGLATLYFDVWLIGFLINAFTSLTMARADVTPTPDPAPPPKPDSASSPEPPVPAAPPPRIPRLEDRLPQGFGAIHALKSEDHYVRVFGEGRTTLLLMRLRDAIAELGDVDGHQVHRSWWVAKLGVAEVSRQGREAVIRLHDGTQAPVSREAMARLRAAGWV